jgi:hypothetical protein
MAKKKNEGTRKVFLLVDCRAGKCGQVVELDSAEVEALVANGEGDDNEAAIAAHE